jgi:hypothetical protein
MVSIPLRRLQRSLAATLAVGLAAATLTASAHDTWFESRPSPDRGAVLLALGTGTQFPRFESPVGIEQLRSQGCRRGDAPAATLQGVSDTPTALVVRAAPDPGAGAAGITCWAQLVPFDIELAPDKIKRYLDEIHPPQAVLDAWADMQARGIPWRERYTKHARIELAAGTAPPGRVPMDMDVLLENGQGPVHAGDTLVFQVLRDGAPLADFSVELRGDRSRFGLWRKTDAEGRIRIPAPLAGHWVLRGTDLRLSASVRDAWESRFVTLAFEIVP